MFNKEKYFNVKMNDFKGIVSLYKYNLRIGNNIEAKKYESRAIILISEIGNIGGFDLMYEFCEYIEMYDYNLANDFDVLANGIHSWIY